MHLSGHSLEMRVTLLPKGPVIIYHLGGRLGWFCYCNAMHLGGYSLEVRVTLLPKGPVIIYHGEGGIGLDDFVIVI